MQSVQSFNQGPPFDSRNAALLLMQVRAVPLKDWDAPKMPSYNPSPSPKTKRPTLILPRLESDGESTDEDSIISSPRPRIVSFDSMEGLSAPVSPEVHRKWVGDSAETQVRAVLRKKFSWKNYPELETYLVDHRLQYLQYSSNLNYTAEQKQYNNKLTQGLLDLAAEVGYVFEEFTFAMVRDRIRCYYKSFVQATKKKKRKKRRA